MPAENKNQQRSRVSAGLLMYRLNGNALEVFLGHPGGPFFAKKNEGVWSIPKGEVDADEDLLQTALREFEEETGIKPKGEYISLGHIKQKNGKIVHAWAFKGDWDKNKPIRSNTFTMEWPPHSGQQQEFPEIDQCAFFDSETARKKINPAQIALIERLQTLLEHKDNSAEW
jgi:predicted NUDIX family NTP pyrophosphohydrolase